MNKSFEKRLSTAESGMTITNNSNADLKHKINNATHIFEQFTTRNTQLEKRKERLARE